MFKVAIIGGNGFNDYTTFVEKCVFYLKDKAKSEGIMIYTCGDRLVDQFSKHFGIDVKFFPTNWNAYGKNALKVRNEEMLKDCNGVIHFVDGIKDTDYIAETAKERKIPCRVVKRQS